MINGHTVQQSQIQNLFHSVQLNVNNPHFLIMQGRITKVLNMKPEETLSMIEEAAGTRMFETKKQAALKTIEKKQLKVEELTKCMNEEITPTLSNLRSERQNYITWQSNNTELERLERFCVASEFCACEEKVQSSENDKLAMINELESLTALQNNMQAEADDCERRVREIETLRESESEGKFQELKKLENEAGKELVKLVALNNNHKESLQTEKDLLASLNKQMESVKQSIKSKETELETANADLSLKESECMAAEKHANTLKEKYQNAVAGMADESNAELLSLPEQVALWEKRVRETLSQQQQSALRCNHIKETVKTLRKSCKEQEAAHNKLLKEADAIKKQISDVESKLGLSGSSDVDENTLRSRAFELKKSSAILKDKIDSLSAQIEARLNFEFKDPVKGFDRSRVKGLVAKLISIEDPKSATALEIVAGAKLYQVIVDTEETSKLLLQKGQLKKRVTILPLNKISSKCTDNAKVATAKKMASAKGGKANLALELVGYDEELKRAMEYVFGNTIVCDKPEIAKEIAFAANIRTKTVTLDGDSYDPSGTLTGGSKGSVGVILGKLDELAHIQSSYDAQISEMNSIQATIQRIETIAATNKDATKDLELKRHALSMCESKMSESTYTQVMNEITAAETELAAIESDVDALKKSHENAKEELKKLQNVEKNAKKARETAMKDSENVMRAAQKISSTVKTELNTMRNKRDAINSEISALNRDFQTIKEQFSICEKTITRMEAEFEALNAQLTAIRVVCDEAKEAVASKQKELNGFSSEIKALEAKKEKCTKTSQNASLDARKLQHKLKVWEKDAKDAVKAIATLLKQHPWIEKEKSFFGVSGSDYDFAAKDVQASKKRLSDLKDGQDKLAKKINKKVMGMIEKAESEYEELARKKEVILNDKAKIEAVIEELDVKKEQALQTTWTKVNRDFGSIFSTLLPGVTAKLEPPEGCRVADGLEVKVAFNGVWKESLTELSGGQRSLLALSLILALLLFKPAPMYILDEVDAALDLSHTQNIGLMLRTHFSTSQFIVVSLKEGMFNNANVIFRTKFVDGVSAVTRTVVGGNNRNKTITNVPDHDEEVENTDVSNKAPSKKKGKSQTKKVNAAEGILLDA